MRTALKIAGGIIIAGVVLIVGCTALLGAGIEGAENESDETAITLDQYENVKTGETTLDELRSRFGEPESSDEIQAEGVEGIPESDFEQNCVYYNRKGELAALFQFCADGSGTVTSKSAF